MANKIETANQITDLLHKVLSDSDKWWILAQALECHTVWGRTRQGSNYWQTVRDHMMENAKNTPQRGQRVCLKEDVELGPITLRCGSSGFIQHLDPIRVKIDGMPDLVFAIPEDKLSLR